MLSLDSNTQHQVNKLRYELPLRTNILALVWEKILMKTKVITRPVIKGKYWKGLTETQSKPMEFLNPFIMWNYGSGKLRSRLELMELKLTRIFLRFYKVSIVCFLCSTPDETCWGSLLLENFLQRQHLEILVHHWSFQRYNSFFCSNIINIIFDTMILMLHINFYFSLTGDLLVL